MISCAQFTVLACYNGTEGSLCSKLKRGEKSPPPPPPPSSSPLSPLSSSSSPSPSSSSSSSSTSRPVSSSQKRLPHNAILHANFYFFMLWNRDQCSAEFDRCRCRRLSTPEGLRTHEFPQDKVTDRQFWMSPTQCPATRSLRKAGKETVEKFDKLARVQNLLLTPVSLITGRVYG